MASTARHDERSGAEAPLLPQRDRMVHSEASHDASDSESSLTAELADEQRAPLQLNEKLWVTGTLSLILFLILSGQIILVLYQRDTPTMSLGTLLLVLGPFNVLSLHLLANYYLSALRSPGRVPPRWVPAIPDTPAFQVGAPTTQRPVEVKKSGAPRWCKVCRAPKPPRAHHCKACQRCTLRMDHHCPWIANCVGHRNYSAFLRFLAAVDVTCTYHLVMVSARVADYWGDGEWRPPTTPVMVLMVVNYALCIPVLLLVGMFSLYHFYCAMCNSTTIEGWEKDRVATMVRRGRVREIQYPYDLGAWRNLQAALGRNPLLWCWPATTPGDGLHYPLREGADYRDAFAWPPRDPTKQKRMKAHEPGTAFQLAEKSPFTYGDSLNPALRPTNGLRRRATGAGNGEENASQRNTFAANPDEDPMVHDAAPPWHPASHSASHDSDVPIDTDAEAAGLTEPGCIPPTARSRPKETFATLWANSSGSSIGSEGGSEGGSSQGGAVSRVRRGSEGYEVRPKRFDIAFARDEDEWPTGADGGGVGYLEDEEGEYSDYNEHGEQVLTGGSRGDDAESDDDWGSRPGSEDEGDWAARDKREEEIRRRLFKEGSPAERTAYDPPPDWRPAEGDSASAGSLTASAVQDARPMLPSEIMRRRVEWHAHLSAQLATGAPGDGPPR